MVAMAISGGRQTMEMTCASRASALLGAVRATAASSLAYQANGVHAHPAVDGLAHVIDGKGGDGHRREGLHLHARTVYGARGGLDLEALPSSSQLNVTSAPVRASP